MDRSHCSGSAWAARSRSSRRPTCRWPRWSPMPPSPSSTTRSPTACARAAIRLPRLGARLVVAAPCSARGRGCGSDPRRGRDRAARPAADRAARGSAHQLAAEPAAVRGGGGAEGADGRRGRRSRGRPLPWIRRRIGRRVLGFLERHLDGRGTPAAGRYPSARGGPRLAYIIAPSHHRQRSLHGCHEGPRRR